MSQVAASVSGDTRVEALLEQNSVAVWQEYRRTRDVDIRNGLVLQHMGLVYRLANRYAGLARDSLDDLVQEGCLGLIRAVERFRPEYGLQFSTYAYPVISGSIKNYLRSRRRLLGQSPWERGKADDDDASDPSRPTLRRGEELFAPADLEQLTGAVTEDFTRDVIERLLTGALLERLPLLERRILQHFFYDDLTQREVARQVSRSTSRISRLMRRALERVRLLLLSVEQEDVRLVSPASPSQNLILPSVVDADTGLFSPAHLHRCLRREIKRAHAFEAPLTVALLRPESGGVPLTPKRLSRMARRIYQQVRVLDHVFRAGPQELALVFSLPPAEATLVCERFHDDKLTANLACAIASYPRDGDSSAALLEVARRTLDQD